jgi:hypothetical protein
VDAHHIRHWVHGGETKPSNLVTLCRFHHRQVHEGRVVIQTLDDGALRFLRPDGRSFDSLAPGQAPASPSDWRQLPALHHRHGVQVDRDTATTLWRGERMDYGLAVEVLLHQARRARDFSAATPETGASV